MKNLTKPLTSGEIRKMGIKESDSLSYDFLHLGETKQYILCINEKRVLSFEDSRHRTWSYDKIRRMGLGWGARKHQNTDEEDGIIQASKNGENPFAYSIICANPELNEIVR
jgi:hypothetical protein